MRNGNPNDITLITGGNKGLGYEAARRLIAEGHQVYLGARETKRGQRAADQLGVHFLQLDVAQQVFNTNALCIV